jgi:hypothetical protein
MKQTKIIFQSLWKYFHFIIALAAILLVVSGCHKDDKTDEVKIADPVEAITKATLTFTPTTGDAVIATATDPDGTGSQKIASDGIVNLMKGTTYVLTIALTNELAAPGTSGYDVSKEVENEGDEHQFFFAWNGLFSDPVGTGNIDDKTGTVNYSGGSNSKDKNGLALGLTTTWTTASTPGFGRDFRVLLKHQPNLKSVNSNADTGETDLDVVFTINAQ